MFVRVWVRAGILLLASVLTGSCGSLGPVRGISPTLQAADVERASSDVRQILYALAADTGVGPERPDRWYLVAEAGFNYVDDRCSTYFYSLFRLNRRREAFKSSFGAFGQTTNAILQATGATTVSMTVVAQAFGLASAMTDIVAGTFLFELPPATTREFVSKLQRAYRTGAAEKRMAITTPTTAYHVIQDYLSLCLPPTIEARLIGHVATADAVPNLEPGANIDVLVGSKLPVPLRPVGSVRERLPPVTPPPAQPLAKNATERRMPTWRVREVEIALCLRPTGHVGPTLREAVVEFYRGRSGKAWEDTQGLRDDILQVGITPRDWTVLSDVADETKKMTCRQRSVMNACQVGNLYTSGPSLAIAEVCKS
jgi:hypothetical protein